MKARSILATLVTLLSLASACDDGSAPSEFRSADAAVQDVLPALDEDAAWESMPAADEASIDAAKELLACDPDYFAAVADSCIATGDCKDEVLPGDALPDEACLESGDDLRGGSCSAGQIGTCTIGGTAACIRETWLPPGVCASVTAASCAAACCSGRTRQCYNWN